MPCFVGHPVWNLVDFLILGRNIKTREAMWSQSRTSVLFPVHSPFKGTVSVISKKPSSDSHQYPLNHRQIKDEGECAIHLDRKSIQKVTWNNAYSPFKSKEIIAKSW